MLPHYYNSGGRVNLKDRIFLLLSFLLLDITFAGPPTYVVAPTTIGGQSIPQENSELKAPLVNVSFSHFGYGQGNKKNNGQGKLYARLYSQGTSGQVFEYFILHRGQFNNLGLYPEISYDDEEDVYFSLEKDGQRILKTNYSFKNNKFQELSSEIHGGANESSN